MSATDPSPSRNVDGRYSITEECDGCGICASYSAYSLAASADAARYFIVSQPAIDSEEEALLRDAMQACPLGCIRDDGPA